MPLPNTMLHPLQSGGGQCLSSACAAYGAKPMLTLLCCVLQKQADAQEYHKLIVSRLKEQRERRSESLAKKRAVRMASQASAQEATTGKQPTS